MSNVVERFCRSCQKIKPHLQTEEIYNTFVLSGIQLYSVCRQNKTIF